RFQRVEVPAHGGPPRTRDDLLAAFDPAHARALVSGWGGALAILDLARPEAPELERPAQPAMLVLSVAISPDGTRAASGAHDGMIHVWDTARGSGAAPLEQLRAGQPLPREQGGLTRTVISAV